MSAPDPLRDEFTDDLFLRVVDICAQVPMPYDVSVFPQEEGDGIKEEEDLEEGNGDATAGRKTLGRKGRRRSCQRPSESGRQGEPTPNKMDEEEGVHGSGRGW